MQILIRKDCDEQLQQLQLTPLKSLLAFGF